MPLKKFTLILCIAIAAAAATIWLATIAAAAFPSNGPSTLILVPAVLALYAVWRAIARRLDTSRNDHGHYDSIKK